MQIRPETDFSTLNRLQEMRSHMVLAASRRGFLHSYACFLTLASCLAIYGAHRRYVATLSFVTLGWVCVIVCTFSTMLSLRFHVAFTSAVATLEITFGGTRRCFHFAFMSLSLRIPSLPLLGTFSFSYPFCSLYLRRRWNYAWTFMHVASTTAQLTSGAACGTLRCVVDVIANIPVGPHCT